MKSFAFLITIICVAMAAPITDFSKTAPMPRFYSNARASLPLGDLFKQEVQSPKPGKSSRPKLRNIPTQHRVFVSNLPRNIDDEALRDAFEGFGVVEEAKVPARPERFRVSSSLALARAVHRIT